MQTSASTVPLGINGQIMLCRKCLLQQVCDMQVGTPLEDKTKYAVKLISHDASENLAN